MPKSSKPRRARDRRAAAKAKSAGAAPRKPDPRQAAPGHDLRPRRQTFGDGRPPRLPGRTGGR